MRPLDRGPERPGASARSVWQRCIISRAARRVKLNAITRSAGIPLATSHAIRAVSAVVLPVPAPARIRSWSPAKVAAARCSSFSRSTMANTRSILERQSSRQEANAARLGDGALVGGARATSRDGATAQPTGGKGAAAEPTGGKRLRLGDGALVGGARATNQQIPEGRGPGNAP